MELKTPLQRFYGLLKIYRKDQWQIFGYAFFSGLVNLTLPIGIQSIINYIQMGEISTSWVILVIMVLVGIGIGGLLQVVQLRIVENIQHDIFTRSAMALTYRIPKLDLLELDNIHLPELTNRFFDTLTIQKGIPKIMMDYSLAILQIALSLILLSFYSPFFILLGFILFLSITLIFIFTWKKGLKYSLMESKYKYKLAHWLKDLANNNKSFKFYSDKQFHIRKADELIVNYLKSREQHFKIVLSKFQLFIGIKILFVATFLIAGGVLVMNQKMNIGQFVASEILIILITNSLEKLVKGIESIYDVVTGLEKIGQVTDIKLDNPIGTYAPQAEKGFNIKFVNLSFQFPNTKLPLFEKLNCKIDSGSIALLKGRDGKTTLLKILSGMYTMQSGELLIDEVPIANYQQKFLHQEIGIYFSTNELFDGSIWENLTLGCDTPEKEVNNILQHLGLMDFIAAQPDGIHFKIDSSGRRLPRSIIQKLSLARTLIHHPKMLLLDNPLETVDTEEREAIFEWLTDSQHGWTIVVSSKDDYWRKRSNQTITL